MQIFKSAYIMINKLSCSTTIPYERFTKMIEQYVAALVDVKKEPQVKVTYTRDPLLESAVDRVNRLVETVEIQQRRINRLEALVAELTRIAQRSR